MLIFKPDLADEVIAEIKERLQKIIADFEGEFIEEVTGWGKRRLAYNIDDYAEGIYLLWRFNGGAATVEELDRVIKISDKIIRHIIVKLDPKK
jgi:small subunit ribosomal protein S6